MIKASKTSIYSVFLCLAVSASAGAASDEKAYRYNPNGKSDPFVPLVGVSERAVISGIRGILSAGDIKLQGITVNADGSRGAILNGEIMKVGDTMGRVTMILIEEGFIEVEINKKRHKVRLYE
ncbi:MAG: hypothetical protein HQL30_08580 [Candidatus Omnitrophica bacterium]|nr:hypothetical protein [Candidatus Omnitrophota bacterium]